MIKFKRLARSIANRIGFAKKDADHLAYMKRRVLHEAFVHRFGRQVIAGPFEGIILTDAAAWSGGDQLLQALGTYEQGVLAIIDRLHLSLQPDLICNIGCADGYYALGLAKTFPDARVLAFDIDADARSVARRSAAENGFGSRIEIKGFCDQNSLKEALTGSSSPLILLDCEGYEVELLSQNIEFLQNAHLIIECHDFIIPNATTTVVESLDNSHYISIVEEKQTVYSQHEFCKSLSSFDRLLTVCEFRPEPMVWLYCRPRQIVGLN